MCLLRGQKERSGEHEQVVARACYKKRRWRWRSLVMGSPAAISRTRFNIHPRDAAASLGCFCGCPDTLRLLPHSLPWAYDPPARFHVLPLPRFHARNLEVSPAQEIVQNLCVKKAAISYHVHCRTFRLCDQTLVSRPRTHLSSSPVGETLATPSLTRTTGSGY